VGRTTRGPTLRAESRPARGNSPDPAVITRCARRPAPSVLDGRAARSSPSSVDPAPCTRDAEIVDDGQESEAGVQLELGRSGWSPRRVVLVAVARDALPDCGAANGQVHPRRLDLAEGHPSTSISDTGCDEHSTRPAAGPGVGSGRGRTEKPEVAGNRVSTASRGHRSSSHSAPNAKPGETATPPRSKAPDRESSLRWFLRRECSVGRWSSGPSCELRRSREIPRRPSRQAAQARLGPGQSWSQSAWPESRADSDARTSFNSCPTSRTVGHRRRCPRECLEDRLLEPFGTTRVYVWGANWILVQIW